MFVSSGCLTLRHERLASELPPNLARSTPPALAPAPQAVAAPVRSAASDESSPIADITIDGQKAFLIFAAPGYRPRGEAVSVVQKFFQNIGRQYPVLLKQVAYNGYQSIILAPSESGETGGAVLAQTNYNPRTITIYEGFFTAAQSAELKGLRFSVADVALLHELLHAFDVDNQIVSGAALRVGWDRQRTGSDGYRNESFPFIENIWISGTRVNAMMTELKPLLTRSGPWAAYREARNRVRKFGYPSIYAIVGGPVESFAELGAYVALDPEAAQYIPPATVSWYRQQILR